MMAQMFLTYPYDWFQPFYTVGAKKYIANDKQVGTCCRLPIDATEEQLQRAEDSCLTDINIWLHPPIPA